MFFLNIRSRLVYSYQLIHRHETKITQEFLSKGANIQGLTIHGVKSADLTKRTPTFCLTMKGLAAGQLAQQLVNRGIAAGAGHFYAIDFPKRMGLDGGFTRVGFFHYNTLTEVKRVITALEDISDELSK